MRDGAESATAPALTFLQKLRDRDHTRAGLLGSLVVLALPSALTGLFGGGLFQLAELHFLGLLGRDALAAAARRTRSSASSSSCSRSA